MLIIFKQLESDANDVMDKLERKRDSHCLSSWELEGISIVICQLIKQAYDVAVSGIYEQNEKNKKLSIFLSSEYFETVTLNMKCK
uniref:Uncharacterized protein n=1 Tax=Panagrolaimus davidi TaxID=227884 RepID=A0A914PQ01_9BILA